MDTVQSESCCKLLFLKTTNFYDFTLFPLQKLKILIRKCKNKFTAQIDKYCTYFHFQWKF